MLELKQNSPEWIEFRKTKIGASDAATIMGISPWKTPFQLWEEKIGARENRATASMQRGIDMENEARQAFIKETGVLVTPSVRLHPEHEWMIASLDGIDSDSQNIVEIKCPGDKDHYEALNGCIPEKYYPQMQHQMEVVGVDKAYYFSYHPKSTKTLIIERDDSFIKKMMKREKEFYECIMEFIPPELTDRDFVEKTDEEWMDISTSYKRIQKHLNLLTQEESYLRDKLINLAGKTNAKGNGVKLSRIMRRGVVNYKNIPELKDVNLEAYRKPPMETWRVTFQEEVL